MKIVHIIDSLKTGGAEVLLFSTIQRLTQFEHHIITLIPDNDLVEVKDFAQVYVINHLGWHSTIKSCKRIRNVVNAIKPDIIHSHLFLSSFLTRLALRRHSNIVYSIHTLYSEAIFKKPHLKLMEKMVYSERHKLVAVSNYVLNDYKRTIRKCKNGFVLYNFIEDDYFESLSAKNIASMSPLKKWIAVGTLKAVKNYEGIISLFEKYYQSVPDNSGLSIDIYGNGPLRDKLERKAKESGLPVKFLGKVGKLSKILNQYDAFISASFYEGYGIAPMEALAVGLPLFLSDIPVYREIYGEYAFFFGIHSNNSNELLKLCNIYHSMSIIERKALKDNGQSYALKKAKSDSYIKQLLNIYSL